MKINQQTKAYVIQWMKNFADDKSLGTLQKIKSIIFAGHESTLYIFNVFRYLVFCNKIFQILSFIFNVSLCPF